MPAMITALKTAMRNRLVWLISDTNRVDSTHLEIQVNRLAAEESARFLSDHMPIKCLPGRIPLSRASLAAVTTSGLYCEFGVWRGYSDQCDR